MQSLYSFAAALVMLMGICYRAESRNACITGTWPMGRKDFPVGSSPTASLDTCTKECQRKAGCKSLQLFTNIPNGDKLVCFMFGISSSEAKKQKRFEEPCSYAKNGIMYYFAEPALRESEVTALIESVRVTNAGTWHQWDTCDEGRFAQGFRLKFEPKSGSSDSTALNAIKMYCMKPGQNLYSVQKNLDTTDNVITSQMGDWGRWYTAKFCAHGSIVGFALRTMQHVRNSMWDNVAATDLRVLCSGDDTHEGVGGLDSFYGKYQAERRCPTGSAVCAIRTQIQPYQGSKDDTALNNVDFKCCSLSAAATKCTPSDQWVTILSCDNPKGVPIKCTYTKKEGVSHGSTGTQSGGWTKEDYAKVGAEVGGALSALTAKFTTEMGTSKTTRHDWSRSSRSDFKEETITTMQSDYVKPGQKLTLQQVVGTCGGFTVRSSHYRSV